MWFFPQYILFAKPEHFQQPCSMIMTRGSCRLPSHPLILQTPICVWFVKYHDVNHHPHVILQTYTSLLNNLYPWALYCMIISGCATPMAFYLSSLSPTMNLRFNFNQAWVLVLILACQCALLQLEHFLCLRILLTWIQAVCQLAKSVKKQCDRQNQDETCRNHYLVYLL